MLIPLFCELESAQKVEVAGLGRDFDGLDGLADGCCFFIFYKEKFSVIPLAINTKLLAIET